jgi:hypothetical protein
VETINTTANVSQNPIPLAAIRRGAETNQPPVWLLMHSGLPAGLYEFGTAKELSDFLHFGNRNLYRRVFMTGGSQPGAIVGDQVPTNPLMLT